MCSQLVSSGNTIVIYDVNDEELILQSVEKYKLDMLPLFPAFGYRILDEHSKNNYDLSTLKFMGTGGSKFPGDVVKELNEKLNVKFCEGFNSILTIIDINNDF